MSTNLEQLARELCDVLAIEQTLHDISAIHEYFIHVQAEARLTALEEAAQVAGRHYPTRTLTFVCVDPHCTCEAHGQLWANHIADAIRALAPAARTQQRGRKPNE
jgi:hypothetical protein